MKTYHVIVLGLGATGSAALYQLSQRTQNVLGLDQFTPPHPQGSSHGETRIIRQAVREGDGYVPLVLRSYEIWRELEQATQQHLLTITGGLALISERGSGIRFGARNYSLEQTIASARKYHIQHELLDTTTIQKRFPQFHLVGDEEGYYEYNAGFLRPELCIQAQLQMATQHGAEIHTSEKVQRIIPSVTGEGVTVQTNRDTYQAEKLILSAGPWVSQFLEQEYAAYFPVYRQVLYWFAIQGPVSDFAIGTFPVFMWRFAEVELYGFPTLGRPESGVKVGSGQYASTSNPDTIERTVSEEETLAFHQERVANRFPDLSQTALKTATCMYTLTPDAGFVLDVHPLYPQLIIASPCSGHGFKHSAAIGEVLAELTVDGSTHYDISAFRLNRFNRNPGER